MEFTRHVAAAPGAVTKPCASERPAAARSVVLLVCSRRRRRATSCYS